jgi:hypothetical protein
MELDSPSALRRDRGMEREMIVEPESVYLRIIAPETTRTPEELESLKLLERWLDTAVYRVSAPMGDAYMSRSGGSLGLEHERSDS